MSRIPTPLPPSLWSDGARRAAAFLAMLAVAAIGFGVGYLIFGGEGSSEAPAPTAVGGGEDEGAGVLIGGTRNTTRFAGFDPAGTAAAIASATHPTDAERPPAVVLAPSESWQLALAATPLVADPIGAPVLLSSTAGMPEITSEALGLLRPGGLPGGDGTRVIAVGGVAGDDELETRELEGDDPATVASEIDELRAEITGQRHPGHVVLVSSEEPGYAMPAAAWAAHSGDAVLFTGPDELPKPTKAALERHPKTPVYVLGPKAAISNAVLDEVKKVASSAIRISADEPVENAIAFARFADDDFGWDINDPGHGFTIASVDEPIDAAIAAPLAVLGKPGPLLLTTDSQSVPAALQGFLADTQPGYVDEPARAIYNHVWIVGGPSVMSESFQRQIDFLTNLVPVDSASGSDGASDRRRGDRSSSDD